MFAPGNLVMPSRFPAEHCKTVFPPVRCLLQKQLGVHPADLQAQDQYNDTSEAPCESYLWTIRNEIFVRFSSTGILKSDFFSLILDLILYASYVCRWISAFSGVAGVAR